MSATDRVVQSKITGKIASGDRPLVFTHGSGPYVSGEDGTRVTMPSLERVVCEHDRGTPSGTVLHSMSNLDHGWGRSGFGPELEAFLRHCRGEQDPGETVPTLGDALAVAELCDRVMDDLLPRAEEPSNAGNPPGRVPVGAAGG